MNGVEMVKYIRWSAADIDFLKIWYPHFGYLWVAEKLQIKPKRVRAKADLLNIKLLPRLQRLCRGCEKIVLATSDPGDGNFCRTCRGWKKLTREQVRRERARTCAACELSLDGIKAILFSNSYHCEACAELR